MCRNLIACAVEAGVDHFIFSSTAAVYGMPPEGIDSEDSPIAPPIHTALPS
ncbi:MAG: NAD-dependent epimerase/dehydratase family protein [Gammaproteobacteria bacterium]